MDDSEIQTELNKLLADMVKRGLREPVCTAMINAEADPQVYLHWEEDGFTYGRTELGRGNDISEALYSAREILEAIPAKEDRDRAEFARLLANAIDKGRSIGIEVDFLNPLTEAMKRLSENALTYRAPPEPDLPF